MTGLWSRLLRFFLAEPAVVRCSVSPWVGVPPRVDAMDAYLLDWVNLLLRWVHAIAAIAWIGASFYFVTLYNGLSAPLHDDLKNKGADGEMWAAHGGGFYHSNKYMLAPTGSTNLSRYIAVLEAR